MKTFTLLLSLIISPLSFGSVVKSLDEFNSCTIYRVANEQNPINENEIIVSDRDVYGLTLTNMEIDFSKEEVLVDPTMIVILGINRNLLQTKVVIKKNNPEFNFLINQLNRKLYIFESMCISNSNELVYAIQSESK